MINTGKVRPSVRIIIDVLVYTRLQIYPETREQRVDSWRNFASNTKKKKKTKTAVLG